MKRCCSVVLVILTTTVLHSHAVLAQISGLTMMKLETGSRPAGMGGAFVSIAGEPFSTIYNPANAHGFSKFTAAFEHNEFWSNARIESGYFAAPIRSRLALFGGMKFATVSKIEIRTGPSSKPDAYADAHDISFKGGFTYRITDQVHAGFAFGWMFEKIVYYRGSSFNVDFGLHAKISPHWQAGASMTNVGSDLTLHHQGDVDSDPIPLPKTLRVGGSYHSAVLIHAVDIVLLDKRTRVHVGAESPLHKNLAVRAGYMFNYESKGMSAGISFIQRGMAIDYAFVPYSNDLDDSHQFTFIFSL